MNHAHFKDETGNRYGRLVVLERQQSVPYQRLTRWICRCDCGVETVATGSDLRKDRGTRSCGCWQREKWASEGFSAYSRSRKPGFGIGPPMRLRMERQAP